MKPFSNIKNAFAGKLRSGKSLVILASGVLLGITSSAMAGETPLVPKIKPASYSIKEHMKFPDFDLYKHPEEKIEVVFTVDENGRVNLVVANTTNTALKQSIEQQFFKLTLKQLKANNAYSIQFNFKTQ